MKDLKDFSGLKLFPGEEILNIQREHWVAVFIPLLLIISGILGIASLLSFYGFSKYTQQMELLVISIALAAIAASFLLSLATHIYLFWYYQFYIITSKRLVHVHFFRIGGFHLDEVFHEQTSPLEIDRNPQNFILDFLGIEDIYVYFHRYERPEPFIFKMPQDVNIIEDILEGYMIKKIKQKVVPA